MIRTSLQRRKLRDPLTAFQINKEIKEIKDLLENLPIIVGKGAPENVVKANRPSLYLRTDGGTSTTLYVKESGTGTTGWVAK